MEKLYKKDEVTFAVVWIVFYCVVIGSLRGSFGDESPWMLLGLAVTAVAGVVFVKKNSLERKYGLAGWPSEWKIYLYFLPMLFLATGNLWGGVSPANTGMKQVCGVLSMALVGFVEELIFRGFLFRGMLKNGNTKPAVIISALTFGVGHIINLLTGQATLDTLIQIPFAVAWGFLFTMAFYKSGSLLPCILVHSLIDVFSRFVVDTPLSTWGYIIATIVISVVYCLYLSRLDSKLSE